MVFFRTSPLKLDESELNIDSRYNHSSNQVFSKMGETKITISLKTKGF